MLHKVTNRVSLLSASFRLLCLILVLNGPASADDSDKKVITSDDAFAQELYWVEPGLEATILVSKRSNKEWLPAEVVYKSNNACASLAVTTDYQDTKYLVWSEKTKTRTLLMLSTKAKGDDRWSDARVLSNFGKENNGASMVLDPSNSIWLFWSSNSGGLDDIYMRKKTDQQWGERVRIHEPNQVPDIKPSAFINDKDEIQVEWTKYDLELGQYVGAVQYFELDSSVNSVYKTEPTATNFAISVAKEVELPTFLPDWAISPLRHFPESPHRQTLKLHR